MAAPVNAKKLLIEIARCPNVQLALKDESHDCRRVVAAQDNIPDAPPRFPHHLPEPWRGHIETAPILFVGSNPSIDPWARFPSKGWADQRIDDYFTAPDCTGHFVYLPPDVRRQMVAGDQGLTWIGIGSATD